MSYDHAIIKSAHASAVRQAHQQLSGYGGNETIPSFLMSMMTCMDGRIGPHDVKPDIEKFAKGPIARMNAMARQFRNAPRATKQFPSFGELVKGNPELAKASMDVGTLTNLANVTGGQSLGYISLDTQIARGTIRPGSFTLYQCLKKTAAFQIVDYWGYAAETGGAIPGAAFASYASVGSGTLNTSAGIYDLKFITLKLALDGRAITTALAAQNSYVDVVEQENTNAALAVLATINWACYWGNPTLWVNQFQGINQQIPAVNQFDFQAFFNNVGTAKGWSTEQTLFNLIYEAAAKITNYRQFGITTHAFMAPEVAGSLQTLVTTVLNNAVNLTNSTHNGMVVNGDLQGMNTRFGDIHFPVDLLINARMSPAAAIIYDNGTSPATLVAPTPPVSVTVTASGAVYANSGFTAAYVASSAAYTYAVASCDANMNESVLTFGAGTGLLVGRAYAVAIAGPAAADAAVFRVYRSGLGSAAGLTDPAGFRLVGEIAANGSGTVTFVDLNAFIPGSDTIFLLDMEEGDNAVDFRYLLPLSKIELFAQNLYMPWAVAMIGALRLRIPKFHGLIKNYVPSDPVWNPLQPST
jgi:hypothetical protein